MRPLFFPPAMALFLALAVSRLGAQEVVGRVVSDETGEPVVAATVEALDEEGDSLGGVLTDSAGAFYMGFPRGGAYSLRVEHIAFATLLTPPFGLGAGEELSVEIRMGVQVIALEPLVVVGRRRAMGRAAEFYERMERQRTLGLGRFVTREEIEERGALRATDLFRTIPRVSVVPGRQPGTAFLTMTGTRGPCFPKIWIDGILMNRTGALNLDDFVSPHVLEGIEVYRGPAEAPPGYFDQEGCGVVLLWTRSGSPDGRPFSWKRLLVVAGIVAAILLLQRM